MDIAVGSSTKVALCECPHPFQDQFYGKGKRLMNHTNGSNRPEWRCTVCGIKSNRLAKGGFAKGGGFTPAR